MSDQTVAFMGEEFVIADRIGLMPLMRFAKVAQSGTDAADMAGLAAMYDLLQQCIAEGDWQRFSDKADSSRADAEQLMEVVAAVMALLTERPTSRPSVSSDGPPITEPNSTADSSSQVMARLRGRPDLQLMVLNAGRASA